MGEANLLLKALAASRRKITVFLFSVIVMVTIFGSVMYLIEGETNGFTSIPRSIYWAIVTLTTVGYGDMSPKTELGQAIASLVMIIGYATIAIPTGIISAEFTSMTHKRKTAIICTECGERDHESDAQYCKSCGVKIDS